MEDGYTINLEELSGLRQTSRFAKGAALPCDGPEGSLFVVLQGEVGAFVRGEDGQVRQEATFGPGTCFGQEALLLGWRPRCAFLALTKVVAVILTQRSAPGMLREEPQLALELMRLLLTRTPPGPQSLYLPPEEKEEASPQVQPETPVQKASPPPEPAVPSRLLPPGHENYTLSLCNEDRVYLMERSHTCPLCRHSFKSLKVRPSRLAVERIDQDMRVHYRGVEPIYYEVVTCPNCLYSALEASFPAPDGPAKIQVVPELARLKAQVQMKFGTEVDTNLVFTGYYLALRCGKAFSKAKLQEGKLLLNLSRIYADCGDEVRKAEAEQQALAAYLDAYERLNLSGDQIHQLCMMIGNLSVARNDLKTAKNFFFQVKTSRDCAPALRREAENRLYDLREAEGKLTR